MLNTVFVCDNPKCAYAIASDSLNVIQLRVLRQHTKTCPKCNQRTKWQEQVTLLDTKTTTKDLGGSNNESLKKNRQRNNQGSH